MCLYPKKVVLYSFFDISGEIVKRLYFVKNSSSFDFDKWKISYSFAFDCKLLDVPCQKCVECLIDYSSEWSFRIMNECSLYKENCFITLTYSDNPISLNKRDLQLFLKRLRRKLEPLKIRYFACGEYGKKGKRPHYHIIIFGWIPKDLEFFFKDSVGAVIYKSSFLAKIWNKGFISVSHVDVNVAKYVSKYMQKLNDIPKGCSKPFLTMSLKPGIGYGFLENNIDISLLTDKVYIDGKYHKLPRYYLKVLEKMGFDLSDIKKNREVKSLLLKRSDNDLMARRISAKKKFGKLILDKRSKI